MAESNLFSQMVVIGSSAGGIEALSTLVQTLPTDFPAPVVLAQHLDPSRESHLGDILSHSSTLPVRTLSEYERLEPGVVYVVPANRDVEITDHDIRLRPGTGRSRPSIDHLFASAADIYGDNLIAVVLTGTGNDGAAGALEVRQAGGTVIIQDPATASFPALPRSLAPSAIDFIIPLEEIGPLLKRLLVGAESFEIEGEHDGLELLLRLLREWHGLDFRSYKRATILRRVMRRVVATGSRTSTDYLRYLQQRPDEQHALIGSFLIKVTRFFRDPDLFAELRERTLPSVIDVADRRDHTIRVWSAGCATGEEAYSIAILLAECLGDSLDQFHIRIFATDLDPEAITFARQGLYSAASLSGVDKYFIDRYFDVVDGGFQISKRIRALMVFGEHDLADRAPFPRVDLVVCRNVLIYFTTDLQRRILQLFAFSLRDGGYLVLGKSETTTPFGGPFVAEDARLKVYRRRGSQTIIPSGSIREAIPPSYTRVVPSRPSLYGKPLSPQPPNPPETQFTARADATLLDLPIGVVVVDHHYDIQYLNEMARLLFGIHSTALSEDLIHLVQTVSPAELRALIDRALAEGSRTSGVLHAIDGASDMLTYLEVTCEATSKDGSAPRVTVCVADRTDREQTRLRVEQEVERANEARERAEQQRLHQVNTNRELLTANQQLTHDMAELRSANEEFLVNNEELQAATEEVETLNEELQATNEELETLNEELQATVEELNTTNDDLQSRNAEIQGLAVNLEFAQLRSQAVLNSLGDAIAVIDKGGETVRTNARYDALFGVPLDTIEVRDGDGAAFTEHDQLPLRGARGEAFQVTALMAPPDGASHRYQVTGWPIRGADGDGGVIQIHELGESESS